MKRMFVLLLTFCVLVVFNTPLKIAEASSTDNNLPIPDKRVIKILEENNIDFHIENGYEIKLSNPTSKLITNVNNMLEESMAIESQSNVVLAKSYLTPWTHMVLYDRVTSKKFTKATKTAFVTALTGWLGGITGGAATLAKLAGAGFGGYYFVNTDQQNVYSFSKYYYRELGPPKFTSTGSVMGDYQIRKVSRVTKSANGTGGQSITRYKKSTILEPFF